MRKEFAPRQFKKLYQFFLWFAFAQKNPCHQAKQQTPVLAFDVIHFQNGSRLRTAQTSQVCTEIGKSRPMKKFKMATSSIICWILWFTVTVSIFTWKVQHGAYFWLSEFCLWKSESFLNRFQTCETSYQWPMNLAIKNLFFFVRLETHLAILAWIWQKELESIGKSGKVDNVFAFSCLSWLERLQPSCSKSVWF